MAREDEGVLTDSLQYKVHTRESHAGVDKG